MRFAATGFVGITLGAALGLLGACEYDARISLNPPNWAAEPASAVRAVGACAAAEQISLAFALVDDRGAPVVAGGELELATGDSVVVGPAVLTVALASATLTPAAGGDITTLAAGAVAAPSFASAAGRLLAVVVEASSRSAEEDPDDERVRAAELAARDHLRVEGNRVAVYALTRGVLDARLPFSSAPDAVASAIAAVAGVEGGDASVFDAVVGISADVRAASTTGGAILFVGTSLVERGSQTTLDDARATLAAAPPVQLFAVGFAVDTSVRSLACASSGGARAAEAAAVAHAALDLAAAVSGVFVVRVPRPAGLAAGAWRFAGELEVGLASSERRTIPFDLELDFDQ